MNREERIAEIKKGRMFRKWDILVFLIAAAAVAAAVLLALYFPRSTGDYFSVYYRNESIFTGSMEETCEYVFFLEDGDPVVEIYDSGADYDSYNVISVSDGTVCVCEADCRTQYCVHQGKLSSGDIVCAAHYLRIAVTGDSGGLETDY